MELVQINFKNVNKNKIIVKWVPTSTVPISLHFFSFFFLQFFSWIRGSGSTSTALDHTNSFHSLEDSVDRYCAGTIWRSVRRKSRGWRWWSALSLLLPAAVSCPRQLRIRWVLEQCGGAGVFCCSRTGRTFGEVPAPTLNCKDFIEEKGRKRKKKNR